jgi:MYXO-CTERM domain-containing protein
MEGHPDTIAGMPGFLSRSASIVGKAVLSTLVLGLCAGQAQAEDRNFAAGSLIIPMDQSYQDSGMLQSYGLLFQLLRQGVPVTWVIDQTKTWHHAPCDAVGDNCLWDCEIEGSGVKCDYPTASPDFFVASKILHDDSGTRNPGDLISNHGYRGGPFVIDASHKAAALPIISEWNNATSTEVWSTRTVFNIVSVHEATAAFTGFVAKDMIAAPSIAVFSDGNENIATRYIRSAGIFQSNGSEFPEAKCGVNDCGPGTANPDMLTVQSIMGDMGTCDNLNYDHRNGSLFTNEGVPAYCQIMSMKWGVNDRETVECDGGNCPATQAECTGQTITYHGHEVVAEVRKFLEYPVHFFAECQAVNAYENTTPNPAWPYLDDDERDGHFLTTSGVPPACPCTDAAFECVIGGCAGADCCLPSSDKDLGAGFLVADTPDSATLQVLHPEVPYNQFDGVYGTIGGREPSYNLSSYLGTEYKNGREVTFLTSPLGPGDHDVWMTGYVDGECDIVGGDDVGGGTTGECNTGKVSYLGGHSYDTDLPMSANNDSKGAKLFLNALFEADCVTSVGQPSMYLDISGNIKLTAQTVPVEIDLNAIFANQGRGVALDATMRLTAPASVTITGATNGTVDGQSAVWTVGSVSADPALPGAPPSQGTRMVTLGFPEFGNYDIALSMEYTVGLSTLDATPRTVTVELVLDTDGDGIGDVDDPEPENPNACGDSDADTCDDCTSGSFDPDNDGTDTDGDGTCDAGEAGGTDDGSDGGCGCRVASHSNYAAWLIVLALFGFRRRSRGKR